MERKEQDIEVLISRSLDGALSEEEQLALDRELIRNPDAQRMMDAYRQVDSLAASALEAAFTRRDTHAARWEPAEWIKDVDQRRSWRLSRNPPHRGWWLVPGAIAAALLAVVVSGVVPPKASQVDALAGNLAVPSVVAPIARPSSQDHNSIMRSVSTTPAPRRRIQRDTTRDLYGIMGENGRIYWIEIDRTRIIKRPNTELGYRPVSQEM
ncbi:MAG: hypothetical protein IID43_00980 [Planctomycetes bacterium]|nr:hypothetical protein [Planctomycetota bacterium]